MNEQGHERARRLLDAEWVEGLSLADREWLHTHLETCAPCRARAEATERALRSLRSVAVVVNPELVSAAQLRVRLRACELREDQVRMRALWVSCALSWILGVVTAPLVWRAFAWVGHRLALPDLLWKATFFASWIVPAALVGGVVAWWRARTSHEDYAEGWPR